MTVGDWDPNAAAQAQSFEVDKSILNRFAELSRQQQLEQLAGQLDRELIVQQAPLMTLGKAHWFEIGEPLETDQIIELVRFFTVAEAQLPGWEAGAESPVVWLVKLLRQRKQPPSKELLLWIKANSENRFLPNGAL
jgi:hypothetical protein